jgi:hypothetical protein
MLLAACKQRSNQFVVASGEFVTNYVLLFSSQVLAETDPSQLVVMG